jgi:hypothetical protein
LSLFPHSRKIEEDSSDLGIFAVVVVGVVVVAVVAAVAFSFFSSPRRRCRSIFIAALADASNYREEEERSKKSIDCCSKRMELGGMREIVKGDEKGEQVRDEEEK